MARQQYITKKASKGGIKKFGHNAQAAKVAPWPYILIFHHVFVKLTQSANKSNLLDENGMVKISKFIRSFMGT